MESHHVGRSDRAHDSEDGEDHDSPQPDDGLPQPPGPADFLSSLIAPDSFQNPRTREALAILNQSLTAPTAPILMPSDEQVRVQLVSVQALRRLDDQKSLQSTTVAAITFFAGGALAFLVNVFTSATVTPQGWSFFALLVLIGIALSGFLWRVTIKVDEIEAIVYPESMSPEKP